MDKAYICYNEKVRKSYETLIETIRKTCQKKRNAEAYIWYDLEANKISLTFEEWVNEAYRVSKHLVGFIKKFDIVLLFCKNTRETIISFTSLQIVGSNTILVGMKDQFHRIASLPDLNIKAIFIDEDLLSEDVCKSMPEVTTIILNGCGRKRYKSNFINFSNLLLKEPEDIVTLPYVDPEDPTIILLTSGSTGEPKLVQKDQFSFINLSIYLNDIFKSDKFFNDRAVTHFGGFFCIFSSALGQTIVTTIIPAVSQKSDILDIFEKEQCDGAFLMAYNLNDIVNSHVDSVKNSLKNIKTILSSGQMADQNVLQRLTNILSPYVNIIDSYGSTETGAICYRFWKKKNEFHLYPYVEISVRDENGVTKKRGEHGAIWVKGCFNMKYYFSPFSKSSENLLTFSNSGWLNVGDVGLIDSKGCLSLSGRQTDVIKVGCLKVYPYEFEDKLKAIEKVDDVVIVGIPHIRLGETMGAVVKFLKGEASDENVRYFQKKIDDYVKADENYGLMLKIDRIIVLQNEWPRTLLGKINRRELKYLF